jgi:hypothetical protein
MSRPRPSRFVLLAPLVAVAMLGCHDDGLTVAHGPAPLVQQVVAFLHVEETPSSTHFLLRARVRATGGVALPSAFLARVRLAPSIAFVSAPPGDGSVLQAINVVGDEVRIAGASASGLDHLFTLQLTAASRDALDAASLTIDELRDASGNDLRPVLRVATRSFSGRPR